MIGHSRLDDSAECRRAGSAVSLKRGVDHWAPESSGPRSTACCHGSAALSCSHPGIRRGDGSTSLAWTWLAKNSVAIVGVSRTWVCCSGR